METLEDLKSELLGEVSSLQNGILQESEETRIDFEAELKALQVDPREELKPPQIAWKQIELESPEKYSVLGTLGNFSLVIGKAKSRKSFFLNIVVSAAVSKNLIVSNIQGCLPENQQKVLYFDTEQGKYHVQLALKRICKQIKVDVPENLNVYGLRSKEPNERLQLIEYAIESIPGVGLVVIDGIKDLITSINDEKEATMMASKLLKWTEEKNIHIITVLHQNKGDNNARGHIGSELINKAETVLSVTKSDQDDSISIVNPEQCRNRDPNPFAFEIIDNLPKLVENFELKTKKKFDLVNLPNYQLYQILNSIFSRNDEYSYAELMSAIKFEVEKVCKVKRGDNKIKELITLFKNRGWLVQEKRKMPYTLGKYQEE